ncbi:hypothetical protein BLNAU_5441 [Blattamonas nauphoetae]|uniref:Uncharacterized protein n=1 Tax=Blattamonas nauphoetae TaxID=2049346 RepID=A0ABQ9Y7L0_9EUKA|nr:hypothetical protein BLNAU_5441 [Blattamonas nauphoetae]
MISSLVLFIELISSFSCQGFGPFGGCSPFGGGYGNNYPGGCGGGCGYPGCGPEAGYGARGGYEGCRQATTGAKGNSEVSYGNEEGAASCVGGGVGSAAEGELHAQQWHNNNQNGYLVRNSKGNSCNQSNQVSAQNGRGMANGVNCLGTGNAIANSMGCGRSTTSSQADCFGNGRFF